MRDAVRERARRVMLAEGTAPPLSLRSFKYATKREDRARGRGGETQNTGEEEVGRGPGVEMGRRGEEGTERLGAGPEPQGPPSCPPITAAAPEGATDVSLPRGAQRAGWGTQPPPLLQPGLQSWGLCQ